ncbi:MAG: cytochrome c family protein [Gammaproteobacteria bacterium]
MTRFSRRRMTRRREALPGGPLRRLAALVAASSAALLVGCGSAGEERAFDPAANPELARGELLSFACRACHGLAPGDPSPLGPTLHGMLGRRAGSLPGYDYSQALKDSGIVWTEETLDAWLARPDEYIPGNKMAFAGYRSADDRRALIEYLKLQTEKAP